MKKYYHGSDKKIKEFNPCSLDLGNSFQDIGWSTFCFKDFEYTKKFTMMRFIQNYFRKIRNEKNTQDFYNNRCTWDYINKCPITTKKGMDNILKHIVGKKIYIHEINASKLKLKGIGNDITHNEVTFRDKNVKPIKIIIITLTKELIEKNILIVEDVNKYRSELVEKIEYYNRGLLTLFIKYDYNYNREEVDKIIDAIHLNTLCVGDDLHKFIIENNIKLQKVPFRIRLKRAVCGELNHMFFKKKVD